MRSRTAPPFRCSGRGRQLLTRHPRPPLRTSFARPRVVLELPHPETASQSCASVLASSDNPSGRLRQSPPVNESAFYVGRSVNPRD